MTIGIEKSKEMLEIARTNTNVIWYQDDMDSMDLDIHNIGIFLMVDSIYFSSNYEKLINKLNNKLIKDGVIICFYSEYIKDENIGLTRMERLLTENQYEYTSINFTNNEKLIWENRINVVNELKEKYISENMEYLFYDKLIEATCLLKKINHNQAKRLLFIVSKKT